MRVQLDSADREIIRLLREDARLSLRDLASKVNLSAPAIACRIKRLEAGQVIRGYRAIVSKQVLGLEIEAFIRIKLLSANNYEFLSYMQGADAVSDLCKITGEYSYLIKASFDNTKSLNAFVEHLNLHFGPCTVEIIIEENMVKRSPLYMEAD